MDSPSNSDSDPSADLPFSHSDDDATMSRAPDSETETVLWSPTERDSVAGDEASSVELSEDFVARPAEKPIEIPATKDLDQLRLATSAVTNRGISLQQAAEEYAVDPDTLFIWHRTYVNFVGKDVFAATGAGFGVGANEHTEIDRETSRKFDRNWAEMLRIWEEQRPQLSPLHKWLIKSPFTRWVFRGEQLEPVTIVGALAVLAFSALAIKAGTSHRGDDGDATAGEQAAKPPAPLDPSDIHSFQGERQDEVLAEIADELQTFVKLETWEERLRFVRKPDTVRPLMEAYYKKHPDGPMDKVILDPAVSFIQKEDAVFVLMQGQHEPQNAELGSPPAPVIFLAELRDEEPKALFDWQVLVNYEPVPWPEFRAAKATKPSVFRLRVAQGDYFNQPFMDSEKYASYAMLPLHRDQHVYGFVERGSEIAKEMEGYLSKELNQNRAMILKLSFPADAKYDNILKIDEIVSEGWLEE